MKKLGVGIVGFGFIGRVHALAFSSLPFYYHDLPFLPEIRGVCTSHPETAQRAKEEMGIDFATHQLDELLDREEIDLLVVATPNRYHQEAIEKALSRGLAVYCDKPLAFNLAQAKQIQKLMKVKPAPFGMAFQNRFVPALWRAKLLREEGRLGEIFRVRALYLHSGYSDPERPMSWRLRQEIAGGGALADLGSHLFDLLHFILGDYQVTSARGRTFIPERKKEKGSPTKEKVLVDDWSLVDLEFPEGVGSLEASRFATGSCDELRLEVEGSRGAFRYNSMQPNFLQFYDLTEPAGSLGGERGFKQIESVGQYPPPSALRGKFSVGWLRFHIACAHDFILRLAGEESRGATFEDGLLVQSNLGKAYSLMGPPYSLVADSL